MVATGNVAYNNIISKLVFARCEAVSDSQYEASKQIGLWPLSTPCKAPSVTSPG